MIVLTIHQYPHPILHKKTKVVTNFDETLHQFTKDMLKTMYQHRGIGLAATQVGDLRSVLVMAVPPEDINMSSNIDKTTASNRTENHRTENYRSALSFAKVMINPQLLYGQGQHIGEESCLSLPKLAPLPVKRFATVDVSHQDITGKPQKLQLKGLEAVCFQHELDHLHGKLIIDHQPLLQRQLIKKQLLANQSTTDSDNASSLNNS